MIFNALMRRWSVRRYLRVLPRRMAADYGHRGPYTPAQVARAIERYRLSARYVPHAVAIFCEPEAAEAVWRDISRGKAFDEVRADVASTYFGDDIRFTYAAVNGLSGGNESGEWGHGGHSGGDGGGGHHH